MTTPTLSRLAALAALGLALAPPAPARDTEVALSFSAAGSLQADLNRKGASAFPELLSVYSGPWKKLGLRGGLELWRTEGFKLWGQAGFESGLGSPSLKVSRQSDTNPVNDSVRDGSLKLTQATLGLSAVWSSVSLGEYSLGLEGRNASLDYSGTATNISTTGQSRPFGAKSTFTDVFLKAGVGFVFRRPTYAWIQRIEMALPLGGRASEPTALSEGGLGPPSKDLVGRFRPGTELSFSVGVRL